LTEKVEETHKRERGNVITAEFSLVLRKPAEKLRRTHSRKEVEVLTEDIDHRLCGEKPSRKTGKRSRSQMAAKPRQIQETVTNHKVLCNNFGGQSLEKELSLAVG